MGGKTSTDNAGTLGIFKLPITAASEWKVTLLDKERTLSVNETKIEGLPRSVSLNAMTLSSGFTDAYQVGYTTITVSGASLVDVSGNDVTTDYEIEYQPGELKVFPEDIWIHGVKGSFSYTGKKIIQDFRLYDGEVLLEENKDYTVSYKNSNHQTKR